VNYPARVTKIFQTIDTVPSYKEIEIVHQKRHKVISDTVKEIHNLQLSDLSDKQHNIADIREEYKQTIDTVPSYRIGIVT
jgi:hypothetical protein